MTVKGKFVPVSDNKLAKYEQAIQHAKKNSDEKNVLAKPMLWLIRCYRLLRKEWEEKKEKLWEATEYKPMFEEYKERADALERWLRELIQNIATTRDAGLQKRAFQILRKLDEDSAQLTPMRKTGT